MGAALSPKSGFRTPSSTTYWLQFYHDVFDASAHHMSPYSPSASEFINFSRSYGIFPHFAETSDRSNCPFFFSQEQRQNCWGSSIKCRPNISESNSSIYSSEKRFVLSSDCRLEQLIVDFSYLGCGTYRRMWNVPQNDLCGRLCSLIKVISRMGLVWVCRHKDCDLRIYGY